MFGAAGHTYPHKVQDKYMYKVSGVSTIATITELRMSTSEIIEYVRDTREGVLIQKNNEPHAVLLDWATFQKLTNGSENGTAE